MKLYLISPLDYGKIHNIEGARQDIIEKALATKDITVIDINRLLYATDKPIGDQSYVIEVKNCAIVGVGFDKDGNTIYRGESFILPVSVDAIGSWFNTITGKQVIEPVKVYFASHAYHAGMLKTHYNQQTVLYADSDANVTFI